MPNHDPFAPASTARRVHVTRQPAPATVEPPVDSPHTPALVGAGFVDPGPDQGDVVVPTDTVPRGTPTPDPEDTPSEPEIASDDRPRVNDSKARWAEYARAQGGDPGTMTKAELIDQYG